MRITTELFTTKKNKSITFRSPEIADAQRIIDTMVEVATTAPYILNTPESFRSKPLEDEVKWIEKYLENPRGMIILAEHAGKVVGILDFTAYKSDKMRHRGILGVSVHSDMRGEGVGQLFFKKLLQEVRVIEGLTHIELSMMSENHEAYHLYKKVGFKEFGRRPQAYKQPDGSFCDEVMMAIEL
jgi:putative acetyltransferase